MKLYHFPSANPQKVRFAKLNREGGLRSQPVPKSWVVSQRMPFTPGVEGNPQGSRIIEPDDFRVSGLSC